ncbi:uncharacterized protein V1513DRAFT_480261 [Lipomyces chichibuensis]|uniref:uncharacterized protein n=1 Tax=Lipomyces chichibuensis TaxID=1546026 RepID=UPI00334373A8
MPTSDAPPSVPLSFSNNFWGMEENGVTVMFQRMRETKQTCEEIKLFYKERIMIEEEYSRRLLALSRKALGTNELGTLRTSLDTVRGETEQMGKAHANTATQIKAELEDPLIAFAAGMRERRKIVQTTLDKLSKAKIGQQATVQKNRDRYENDCNKVNGYIAQQNMVMGRELEKNNVKLEKAQIAVTASRRDYQASVRNLAETTEKWNREWKAGCDKFQDLEEERIDFLKSNLWAYTNIMSTVCVSDDEYCENIRLSLENCEIEKDICTFVKERGTGQEIPDPPKYINFMDGTSYRPDHNDYSLAQFPRVMNPQFRTSSPQPRTAQVSTEQTNGGIDDEISVSSSQAQTTQLDAMLTSLSVADNHRSDRSKAVETTRQNSRSTPANESESPRSARGLTSTSADTNSKLMTNRKPLQSVVLPFPDEGLSSAQSSPVHSPIHRPVSMSGESVYSNPTTISSNSDDDAETPLKKIENRTPTKETEKRSGWTSPFRRRSRNDIQTAWVDDEPAKSYTSPHGNREKLSQQLDSRSSSPAKAPASLSKPSTLGYLVSKTPSMSNKSLYERPPSADFEGAEPIDPRANVVLSVGGNHFDVTSSQIQPKTSRASAYPSKADNDAIDPIAAALADLKSPDGKSGQKYYGIGIKPANRSNGGRRVPSYSAPSSPSTSPGVRHNEVPPPSHNTPMPQPNFGVPKSSSLVAPPQAITAAEMRQTANEYAARTQEMFQGGASPAQSRPTLGSPSRATQGRPVSRQDSHTRTVSPSISPSSQSMQHRQYPYLGSHGSASPGSRPPSRHQQPEYRPPSSGGDVYFGQDMSPSPQRRAPPYSSMMGRPRSAYGYVPEGQQQPPRSASRNRGGYDSSPIQQGPPRQQQYQRGLGSQYPEMYNRLKSKSAMEMRPQPTELPAYSRDGREVIGYARAMYDYRAAIPEEVSFRKGDILLILHIQEDGWWEAEVFGPRSRPQLGLAPSNFCHML